jgi:hypothetical protein
VYARLLEKRFCVRTPRYTGFVFYLTCRFVVFEKFRDRYVIRCRYLVERRRVRMALTALNIRYRMTTNAGWEVEVAERRLYVNLGEPYRRPA